MGKIIAFANQKGGVGKTTSAVNVAASLGVLGKKVLLVDLDPQGNTTSGVGVAKRGLKLTVKDLLVSDETGEYAQKAEAAPETAGEIELKSHGNSTEIAEIAGKAIVQTKFQNLSLIPATISLAGAEFDLFSQKGSEYCLKRALNSIRDEYDYIIVDCPPSLGMLTVNALAAGDGVIIPMQCEFYSLEGLSQLIITVSRIKQRYNPALTVTGILITMYNGRLVLTAQVVAELKKHYYDKLFSTAISRGVRLSEAPSFGMPVYYHDKLSKGAQEYLEVAEEVIERI